MDGIQHQGIGYPMPSTSWTAHDMTGVERGVTLQKIGEITAAQLERIREFDIPYFNSGWPLETSSLDIDIAKRLGVDLSILNFSVDEPEVVRFASHWNGQSEIEQMMIDLYPSITSHRRSMQAFESYFAHEHRDEMEICRAQIMVVYDNPMGHRLYGRSDEGVETVLAPRAGDLVLLDTISTHALMPVTRGHDLGAVRQAPMRAVFLTIDDV